MILLSAWPIYAYSKKDTSLNNPTPKIQFEETTFDFGIIGQNKKITHIYPFRNAGEKPLCIEKIETSCNCSASVVSKKEIPPGKKGEIRVTFHSGKYIGRQEKNINVYSNDPQDPIVMLLISGDVNTKNGIRPEYLHFGNVSTKKGQTKKIRFYQVEDGELKIERIIINRDRFLFRISQFECEGIKGWEIEVILKPGAPLGPLTEILTIKTNILTRRYIDVPIIANVI